MLTIGILGLGEGRSTMSAALNSSKLNLKIICDANEELCKQRCKEFDFSNYTTKYEEMLKDKKIDIIAIYTPDHLHAERTMRRNRSAKAPSRRRLRLDRPRMSNPVASDAAGHNCPATADYF